MSTRAVDVRVEQLVLSGLDAAAGERAGASLRRELERLVSAGGERWPAATADLAFIRTAALELRPGGSPEAAGREIARAVYGRLAR